MIKLNAGHQYYDGEFKIVVKDKDGNIKQELDWQKNLFLENGMRIIFSAYNDPTAKPFNNKGVSSDYGSHIPQFLFIGTGNSDPTIDQVALDNPVAFVEWNLSNAIDEYEEPATGLHEGFSKVSTTFTYTFNNFTQNYNITELGLACHRSGDPLTTGFYVLGTRALIKDNTGTALPVTVLVGEILQIYYKINVYIDVRRKTGEFTLTKTDAGGTITTETFEYFIQPHSIIKAKAFSNMYSEYQGHQKTLLTKGVKETDDELDSSYSLNDDVYNSITYNNIAPIDQKTDDLAWLSSGNSTNQGNNLSPNYAFNTVIKHDYPTLTHTDRYLTGINTHNHTNGIRAFSIEFQNIKNPYGGFGYTTSKLLVVVKNKANGQGIKKTNTYTWTLEWSYTIGRWQGD